MKNWMFYFLLFSSLAWAHSSEAFQGFGFIQGLKHPILGLDHLLAMLCVGMISSKIGKQAIWQVPACFVFVMAIGCVIGFFGASFGIIEPMIALSILTFGVLLIIPFKLNTLATLITVALFAFVHGYAHGKEMPLFVLPEIYILGFMTATTLIHILGVGIGEIINRIPYSTVTYKITGTGLIGTGLYFIIM
jgi:urease accessory protein